MYFIELHCTSTQGSVDVGCAVGNVTGRRIVVCGPVLIVAGSEARSQSLPSSAVTDVTCCLNQLDHTKCQSKPGTQLRCKSQSSDHTLLRKRNQKDAKGPTSVIWRHWVWRTRFCYQSSQAWIIAAVWDLLTSTKATRTFSRPFLPQKESRTWHSPTHPK